VLREFEPEVTRKVQLKEGALELIREGLFAVVNEPGGTGWRSRLSDPQFAGKTGTAQVMKLGQKQKLDPATQAYLSRDHAWFAAFAPAAEPEIVVVVLNEHGGWGAEAAAPAASKIVAAYFKMKREETAPPPASVVVAPASAPSVATSSVVH
jgi:penicillin-binding protein 2